MSLGKVGIGLAADANQDDEVDMDDYNIWRVHFGATSAAVAERLATVPEPPALVILVVGMPVSSFRRRKVAS